MRLDGNENPYGPSPAAREAIRASVAEAPRYADETITTLTSLLAAHQGVTDSQVLIGTGSGWLLRVAGLLAVTAAPGSELVASQHVAAAAGQAAGGGGWPERCRARGRVLAASGVRHRAAPARQARTAVPLHPAGRPSPRSV
jgi:hypothetical protein